jgi:prepilin-type N-terminal cleavage/methylation domain-containing protein
MNPQFARRKGFTLVEMLVVIVVIAILMGLLLAAIAPVLFTSYNFAVTSEIDQLAGGVESFKTKFGFYPPCEFDFDGDGTNDLTTTGDAQDIDTFKQYLRRIAPNHEQDDTDIENWWNAVGRHLDNDSILVFWLCGLKRSSQFPLTNGNGGAVWDGFAIGDDPNNHVFYEFNSSQLVQGNAATVRRYLQRKIGEQPYLYYDWQRYPTASITIAGTPLYPYRAVPESPDPPSPPYTNYYNPQTFQIVAAGKDVTFGAFTGANDVWSSGAELKFHRDNLTNFSGGILERMIQ